VPKEMFIDDIVIRNNDRLFVTIHDDGSCTVKVGMIHYPASRNAEACRTIGITKDKILALANWIIESENNLPVARGVAK
jgi:hypothetical protein